MEKIEGWADVHIRDGLVEGWFGQDAEEKFPKATLVIGDERVYTESEVSEISNKAARAKDAAEIVRLKEALMGAGERAVQDCSKWMDHTPECAVRKPIGMLSGGCTCGLGQFLRAVK